MPEIEANPGEEKLLILPLGEESKKLTQVISNDTARQIIELLADAPLSASDIAERLQAPISTIIYNLENLESVGLIKVEKIKYSEKGREVKIYAPVRKLIVVVPEKTDTKSVADLLKKYLGVLLAAVFASGIIEFFTRNVSKSSKMLQSTAESFGKEPFPARALSPNITPMPSAVMNESVKSADNGIVAPMATQVSKAIEAIPPSAIPSPAPTPVPAPDVLTRIADTVISHPGLMFFLGCLFIIGALVTVEYYKRRQNSPCKKQK